MKSEKETEELLNSARNGLKISGKIHPNYNLQMKTIIGVTEWILSDTNEKVKRE